MKDDYSKEIHLQCATCGGEDYFETDKDTGVITCKKCNRKYYGGYDEIVNLNQKRIGDEQQLLVNDVQKDIEKELQNMIKSIRF